MATGVFVVGMHRSGTSVATRLVSLLGVPLGAEEDLAFPTPDNPRGYWESRALTAYNDGLLAALGSDWRCPPALAPGWEKDPQFADARTEARAVFDAVFTSGQWAWKDPRNCLTLPFWLDCLDVAPVALLVHRSPLEIAVSLERRDGFSLPYGLALWERYLRHALVALAGIPALVTGYDDVLLAPLEWCRELQSFLGRRGVAVDDVPDQEVLAFVDETLRRAREPSTTEALSSAQRALLDAVERLRGAHEGLPEVELPEETPTTEALLHERRRALRNERDLVHQYLELEDYVRRLGERYIVATTRPDPAQ